MITFKVNPDTLTWEDWDTLEGFSDGKPSLRKTRPILAKCLVDKAGEPLGEEEASKVLGQVPMGDIAELINQFVAALGEVMKETVPPAQSDG